MGAAVSRRLRPAVPERWDATRMPSLAGKVAIVTGANSGIGFETALQLAKHGARVVMACRNEAKANAAAARIRSTLPAATDGVVAGSVECLPLDTSSLESVRHFAEAFAETHERLDLLINNAGVMGGPFGLSVGGHERQFATNHLGHFALTARLFPLLRRAGPGARIVSVSSLVHRQAWLFNEDAIVMCDPRSYNQWLVYADTKACNILFTFELDRRLSSAGVNCVTAVAAHPGSTATDLLTKSSESNSSPLWRLVFKLSAIRKRQEPEMGALPVLYAATGEQVEGGNFFGPSGWGALSGYPTREEPSVLTRSRTAATKLWTLSERLAGLSFDVGRQSERQ